MRLEQNLGFHYRKSSLVADIVNRLTDMGKQALALARNEALFFQHQQIRPEHICSLWLPSRNVLQRACYAS